MSLQVRHIVTVMAAVFAALNILCLSPRLAADEAGSGARAFAQLGQELPTPSRL